MEVPHDAVLLRIFTSVADRWKTGPLYLGIVTKARELHLAGATVLRGPLGFGQSGKLHQGHLFPSTQDLPVVIEIVDSEEKINTFLPVLDEMMESGLVTIEKAQGTALWAAAREPVVQAEAPAWHRNKASSRSLARGLQLFCQDLFPSVAVRYQPEHN